MNNYQLYRSNILLGGQMKYDLILTQKAGELGVKEFHISAISESAPVNKRIKDYLLNFSHQENIKQYYQDNSSSFYQDFVNPSLLTTYPMTQEGVKNYEDTYEMGCRRMSYQLYGTQFSFFCPLWLEKLESIEDLTFKLQIKSGPDKYPLIQKYIKIDGEIGRYFQNYLEYIGLTEGCDWLFDINKTNCRVTGLNAKTGMVEDVKLFELYEDLIKRERPVLEFNNMIVNELNKNYLISKQLFNFNFCFNLEDILHDVVFRELSKYPIYVSMVVSVGDKELELCDFYSNHEFIQKEFANIPEIEVSDGYLTIRKIDEVEAYKDSLTINVLDYLKDDKYVEFIDKNKVLQNTFHWCLSENPKEHFNMYDGFSNIVAKPKTGGGIEISNIPYHNKGTAHLFEDGSGSHHYPWCKTYLITGDNHEAMTEIFIQKFTQLDSVEMNTWFTAFSKDCWVNNIHYFNNEVEDKQVLVAIFLVKDRGYMKPLERYGWISYNVSDKIRAHIKDDKVLFCFGDTNISPYSSLPEAVNYTNFLNYLKQNLNILPPNLKLFYDIFKSPTFNSQIITLKNGLGIVKAHGPSQDIQEVEYFKQTSNKTIIRNVGKIKPMFLSTIESESKNRQYYKCDMFGKGGFDIIKYQKYSNSDYEPKYKSIGYYTYYDTNMGYLETEVERCPGIEYNQYECNKIKYLKPYICLEYETYDDAPDQIKSEVEDCIKGLHNVTGENADRDLSYILAKYKWEPTYTDSKIEDKEGKIIQKYIYNIQIKLK